MKNLKKDLLLKDGFIEFEEELFGQKFRFRTKPGVFSKDRVDLGTRLLLEKVQLNSDDIILDLGCGYGAIGLSISKKVSLGKVYLVDNDIRAINLAKQNSQLNNLENTDLRISDGFSNLENILFDAVLSNPPSHISNQLIEEFIRNSFLHLKINGKLYLVNELRVLPVVKRLLKYYFGDFKILSVKDNYAVSLALKTNN